MLRYCCDWCDKPIEPVRDRGEVAYRLDNGVIKDPDIRKMFPVVCEDCAERINKLVAMVENREIDRARILERNRQLNEARKIKLGTKG